MARSQAPDYDDRREAILDTAARLFAGNGFAESSMSELADSCATSKSLIYHYFSSKEDILYTVMASHIDVLCSDVDAVAGTAADPMEKLKALIRRFMDHYAGAADRQKVLLNELESLPENKRSELVRKQREIIQAAQRLVVAVYPALARDPVRARIQTLLLFGMMNWTHTWFDAQGPLTAGEVADMIFDVFSAGAGAASISNRDDSPA